MHAKRILQPSQFKRTIGCPGWGNLCDKLGIQPKKSGPDAVKGTAVHTIGETCLRKDSHPEPFLGCNLEFHSGGENHIVEITADMIEAVKVYIDEIRRKRAASVGAEFLVEERLDLGWLIPGMFGTADHVIIEPLRKIYVDDYKNGIAVVVEVGERPGDNVQTSLYALGALGNGNPHLVEEVQATIIQPRAAHTDGPIRSIVYEVDELLEWGHDIAAPAAKRAQEPDAPLIPGPHCKWCDANDPWSPAGVLCPALQEEAMSLAEVEFTKDIVPTMPIAEPTPPAVLTGKKLGRILQFADVLDDWIKCARAEGFRRLESGHPDPPVGFKLVQGKMSNRAWGKSEDEVEAVLNDYSDGYDINNLLYDTKLKSPTQIEKTLKSVVGLSPTETREILDPLLAERTPGKPLMVPETDKRPALPSGVDAMFGPPIEE